MKQNEDDVNFGLSLLPDDGIVDARFTKGYTNTWKYNYVDQLGLQAATIHTRDLRAARRNNSNARFHLFGTRLTRPFNDLTISQDIM